MCVRVYAVFFLPPDFRLPVGVSYALTRSAGRPPYLHYLYIFFPRDRRDRTATHSRRRIAYARRRACVKRILGIQRTTVATLSLDGGGGDGVYGLKYVLDSVKPVRIIYIFTIRNGLVVFSCVP